MITSTVSARTGSRPSRVSSSMAIGLAAGVVVLGGAFGCSKDHGDRASGKSGAERPRYDQFTCQKDDDCALSSPDRGCCPECGRPPQAFPRAFLEADREYWKATCPPRPDCPDINCPSLPAEERPLAARCVNQRCVEVKRPRSEDFRCDRDSQCVLTRERPGCCPGCGWLRAVPEGYLKALQALPRPDCSRPSGCPRLDCSRQDPVPYQAVCRQGRCTGESVPAPPPCQTAADCAVTRSVIGDCCPGCRPGIVVHRTYLQFYQTYAERHCQPTRCNPVRCSSRPHLPTPECRAGVCTMSNPQAGRAGPEARPPDSRAPDRASDPPLPGGRPRTVSRGPGS